MKNLPSALKTFVQKYATTVGLSCIFIFSLVFFAHPVSAAISTASLTSAGTAAGLPSTSFPILIARLIRILLGTLGVVAVLIVIYAGWLYMSAGGDDTKVKKAKKILMNAVIGLVLILASYSIASFILGKLLEAFGSQSVITSTTKKYAEPLSGSLGAGIIENHYPARDAVGVPRNTRIFVTFKEPIDPATVIDGFLTSVPQGQSQSTHLNANNVQIYDTATGASAKLGASDVVVTYVTDSVTHQTTFVFKPAAYLGNAQTDTSYTVDLKAGIKKVDGKAAFTGKESSGYLWNFTVSTIVDLTPPKIVSVIPSAGSEHAPNETVEILFNEPMDPIAGTGTYDTSAQGSPVWTNIKTSFTAKGSSPLPGDSIEPGTYSISNGYKTISFTTTNLCAKDACGNSVFCLPTDKTVTVLAKAATLDPNNVPQGAPQGVTYDGLVDAAGNSLDGNGDGKGQGPSADNYTWDFTTSHTIDTTVPSITSLAPTDPSTGSGINAGNIDPQNDVMITFNMLLSSASLNSTNVSIWPDDKNLLPANRMYPMWFSVGKTDKFLPAPPSETYTSDHTVVTISHAPFISTKDGGSDYWPVLTQGIRGSNQFCLFPASGPADATGSNPKCTESDLATVASTSQNHLSYCCNGTAQAAKCSTDSQREAGNGETLPPVMP